MPDNFAAPEMVAYLVVQKFIMGSQLYRLKQKLNRMGIPLSRQTMSNLLIWSAEHIFVPVYGCLHAELVKRVVLHANETTVQVLHEKGEKPQSESCIWMYCTSGDMDKPILLYESGRRHSKFCEKMCEKGFLNAPRVLAG